MKLLFYDAETSGLPVYGTRSHDPCQPHIVQLAALLCDEEGEELGRLDRIIRPDGWLIPDQVSRVHGITQERALNIGEPEKRVIGELWRLLRQPPEEPVLLVGHNESFDRRIIRIALKRFATEQHCEYWRDLQGYCTMQNSTQLCNIPPTPKMIAAGRLNPKSPKMVETYHFLFGMLPENPHNAYFDCVACRRIYLELRRRESDGKVRSGGAAVHQGAADPDRTRG